MQSSRHKATIHIESKFELMRCENFLKSYIYQDNVLRFFQKRIVLFKDQQLGNAKQIDLSDSDLWDDIGRLIKHQQRIDFFNLLYVFGKGSHVCLLIYINTTLYLAQIRINKICPQMKTIFNSVSHVCNPQTLNIIEEEVILDWAMIYKSDRETLDKILFIKSNKSLELILFTLSKNNENICLVAATHLGIHPLLCQAKFHPNFSSYLVLFNNQIRIYLTTSSSYIGKSLKKVSEDLMRQNNFKGGSYDILTFTPTNNFLFYIISLIGKKTIAYLICLDKKNQSKIIDKRLIDCENELKFMKLEVMEEQSNTVTLILRTQKQIKLFQAINGIIQKKEMHLAIVDDSLQITRYKNKFYLVAEDYFMRSVQQQYISEQSKSMPTQNVLQPQIIYHNNKIINNSNPPPSNNPMQILQQHLRSTGADEQNHQPMHSSHQDYSVIEVAGNNCVPNLQVINAESQEQDNAHLTGQKQHEVLPAFGTSNQQIQINQNENHLVVNSPIIQNPPCVNYPSFHPNHPNQNINVMTFLHNSFAQNPNIILNGLQSISEQNELPGSLDRNYSFGVPTQNRDIAQNNQINVPKPPASPKPKADISSISTKNKQSDTSKPTVADISKVENETANNKKIPIKQKQESMQINLSKINNILIKFKKQLKQTKKSFISFKQNQRLEKCSEKQILKDFQTPQITKIIINGSQRKYFIDYGRKSHEQWQEKEKNLKVQYFNQLQRSSLILNDNLINFGLIEPKKFNKSALSKLDQVNRKKQLHKRIAKKIIHYNVEISYFQSYFSKNWPIFNSLNLEKWKRQKKTAIQPVQSNNINILTMSNKSDNSNKSNKSDRYKNRRTNTCFYEPIYIHLTKEPNLACLKLQ